MDKRIHEHARILVDWSARIEQGDNVVVSVGEGAHELAVAVAEQVGRVGANLLTTYSSDEILRTYLEAHDGSFGTGPGPERAMFEAADVFLRLSAPQNTSELGAIPGPATSGYSRARQATNTARMATDWVSTIHPTRALAQHADMAFGAYRNFVYNAICFDWSTLATEMAKLQRLLDAGSEVVIEKDDHKLHLDIENRLSVNSAASVAYDSHNLPSGEVFTAPAGATGEITFDVPMTINGRQVRDVHLIVENGVVVDHHASRNQSVITDVLETDAGSRRFGELGFGMNRNIDRVTNNILFDEKMGDTVHLALGRPYAACFPDRTPDFDSAIHIDLIADLSTDSQVVIDGDVIQRNGRFRWEDGFSDK